MLGKITMVSLYLKWGNFYLDGIAILLLLSIQM